MRKRMTRLLEIRIDNTTIYGHLSSPLFQGVYTGSMKMKLIRAGVAFILVLAAGGAGYLIRDNAADTISIPVQTVEAPKAGSVRLLYSLDQKQNDQEIIALINEAEEYVYFAIYTFTLPNIADALIAAKERGVIVRGIVDAEQSRSAYSRPVIENLMNAGISIVTERHPDGNGIMHIKALVTESAYAAGSYNWTASATEKNDEILEIGTDPGLRQAYENILKRLLDAYKGNAAAKAAAPVSVGTIDYTEAPKYIGEYAEVRGTLVNAHTSSSGTVFLDFCKNYKTCPFSGVIFADDAKEFGDLSAYAGASVILSGRISSYQGRVEIILSDPGQLKR